MNYLIISILIFLFPLQMFGQMFPTLNHYEHNTLAINPAFAGGHDALSATLSYRNQWVGFDNAPKSQMLSVHMPVFNDKVGLGLLVESNSIGIFKKNILIGNYAYRTELRDGKFALGLGFGIIENNSAWNDLNIADEGDAQLIDGSSSEILPTFSFGTYYYTKKYFIGISLPLFLSYNLDKSTNKSKMGNLFTDCNYVLSGGYEIGNRNMVSVIPSLLIKYHPGNPVQFDYNAMVYLKNIIGLGGGYRSKDMLVGMLRCQINYQLSIAYFYDFNFGSLGKYMNGSHEIGLNYVFRYTRNVIGPRQF